VSDNPDKDPGAFSDGFSGGWFKIDPAKPTDKSQDKESTPADTDDKR
jgi:hypothetical protein